MEIKKIDIKEQINTFYRTYALYVIEGRGIPNFYDSLTPVQRLILLNAPVKFEKTIGLVGSVIKTGLYHHGDMSLTKAINKLARPFGNSEPMLEGDGYFGSPVTPKPSSARYTEIKISSATKQVIEENHSLNTKNPEGGFDWIHLEAPVGLVSHIVGIAVGYSSNILPRKMSDMLEYLDGKPKQLKPFFQGFKGSIKRHNGLSKGWLIEGVFEANDSTMTINIGDLPPLARYDSFIKKMYLKLEEFGDQSKVDNNSSTTVDISIKWKDKSTWPMVKEGISKLTKMIVVEGLVFVKDGTLVEYEEVADYLDEFRIHRERVIYKKFVYELNVSTDELDFLRAKLKFLKFMMEKKRNVEEIKGFMKAYSPKIASRLDMIKLTSLTAETVKQTEIQIKETEEEIKKRKIDCEKQLNKCKSLEKGFKGKGKVSINKPISLLDGLDLPTRVDGIEMYMPEEEDPENLEESETTEEENG